jgi:hypothetical protein
VLGVWTAYARALVARKRRALTPAVRQAHRQTAAVGMAYGPALTAPYRSGPPWRRAKVLAERRGSAVFAQPPNASSLVAQASPATALVARSWHPMTLVQLPTVLTNETAFESSGSGLPPTVLANETAFESSYSGPLPAFPANQTAFESSYSGPQPTVPANQTAFGSSYSGPLPILRLQSLPESSFLRVAT